MNLSRQRLMVLLNELYYSKINKIEINYPPLGFIFSIDIGEKCKISIIDPKEYDYKRNDLIKKLRKFEEEIPNFENLINILTISGILHPQNINDMRKQIDDKCKRDLYQGDKMLFIGFDTNILMFRTNRIIQDLYKGRGGICLVDLLSKELELIWDKKYKGRNLQNLPQELCFLQLFTNQPVPKARQARLASVEYRFIKNNPNTRQIVTDYLAGEGSDPKIIASYKKFEKENDVEMVLFSGDMNVTGMVRNASMNLIPVIRKTYSPQLIEINWEQAVELIYVSAIIYGYITLNGMDVYGIWKGKNDDDWNEENLSINTEGEIGIKIIRDLNILK